MTISTPFVAEFLASALRQFIALSTVRGRSWKNYKIAEYITNDETIPGRVSDTTIGRLLDPGYGQEPSEETLASVAAFLIKMRAITQKQLDLAKQAPSLLDAAAFATIFRQPETNAHQSFLANLGGRYTGFELKGDHLLSSDLIIKRFPDAGILVVHEALSLFQIKNVDLLKRETRNLAPETMLTIWPRLSAFGGRDVESFTSTGFVAATSEMITFFLRGTARGFASVLCMEQLDFSPSEDVLGMRATRNSGWSSSEERSRLSFASMPPRERIRTMARDSHFLKNILDKTHTDRDNKRKPARRRSSGHDFFQLPTESIFESEGFIDSSSDSTERLLWAIADSDFDAFRQALADKADPNVLYPGSTDPIVFPLAADGRSEWIEALIATGRCDLTRTGSDGFRASYAPAVTARFFASTGPGEIVRKFSKIALMLHAEETRQVSRNRSGPELQP